jgi:hypothetical protein
MSAKPVQSSSLRVPTLIAVAVLTLSGCATFSKDGGIDHVQSLAADRVGASVTLPAPRASAAGTNDAIKALLAQPLTADAAVQLAILNNPRVKASLATLGVAEADVVQAGRLANPVFSFTNLRNSEAQSIERALLVNLLSVVTMPLRQTIANRQFNAAQLEVAADVVRLASDARKAWISAVAAQQAVTYFEQVRTAAEAGAELAERMARVGNFNKLSHMREQAFYADATAQLAKARLAANTERERLIRLLGLSGPDAKLQLPDRLPDLPATPVQYANAEQLALERRLDVQLARRTTAAVAADLGLTRATGFINVLEAGYVNESESGEHRKNGYEVEIAIPLFDWGDAKIARAEALYMQSVHRTAEVAINAQSEVRESYQSYRTNYDIARHYRDEIVPLRKRIADENMLRYNGMLIGVFELLADAREQVVSVSGYLDALREFWLTQADLELAVHTGGSAGGARGRAAAMPAASPGAGH